MSFRTRLNLFFLLLVVLPLVAVGVVLLRTIDGAERGKLEAAMGAQARAVSVVLGEQRDRAAEVAAAIARDRRLADALRPGDLTAARRRADELLAPGTAARRIRITLASGRSFDIGSPTAVLPVRNELVTREREALGTLEVSVTGPRGLAERLTSMTGRTVEIRDADGERLAGPPGGPRTLPAPSRIATTDDGDWIAATLRERGFGDATQDIVLLARAEQAEASGGERLALVGTLLLFLGLAAAGGLVISRSLQRQVGELLAGAQRLGRGDFSQEIPSGGDDELSQLGAAFNAMSRQLRGRMDELQDERTRLRAAFRRIGESFAANLDREGLLEIVARAAADGVRADAARAVTRAGDREDRATFGDITAFTAVCDRAEAATAQGGHGLASDGDLHALAVRMDGEGGLHGIVTVARTDEPFAAPDAELVGYLSGRAAVSLENVERHEEAAREAHTDALTGLANRRRLDGLLDAAIADARASGGAVSLLLLDLDHFKRVNDQHGHQTGDAVLREVGWALRSRLRDGDTAARFGGEEFAVLVPHGDPAGAHALAERLRSGVAEIRVPVEGHGDLAVTTSIGLATVRGPSADASDLVRRADEALYAAKRAGRNRTISDTDVGEPG
ncbi:MAG: diguanylate cyclase [Solirubrobacteraceae bacterium]|nr:diguanylate cyclase [Solirubrobacteraceae bacterium]